MSSWGEIVAQEPDLMARATARFDSHLHKLLATIRKDGSPRISGIEFEVRDGQLWLAGMPGARKFADLRRDPRLALHSSSPDADPDDPSVWPGDAKLAGTAVEVTDPAGLEAYAAGYPREMPPGDFELFRVDVHEVTVVFMGEPADHIVVEYWREGQGVRRALRK